MTVVIVSSELVELRSISDRIAIISDGKLSGIFRPDASDADFGLAMSGNQNERRGKGVNHPVKLLVSRFGLPRVIIV